MTARRSLTVFALLVLSLLSLSVGCLDLPVYTSAGSNTSSTSTMDASGLSMNATSADPPTSSTNTTSAAPTSTGCNLLDCQPGDPCEGHECDTGSPWQCDVLAQDCPEGQKCAPWSDDGSGDWNATHCVFLTPNAHEPGEACLVWDNPTSGADTCDATSMCFFVDEDTLVGTCVALCAGTLEAPTCPPSFTCVSLGEPVHLCLPACNPLASDCANPDLCIPAPWGSDRFVCLPAAAGDLGQPNDPCEYINACTPGFVCANPTLATECDPMAAGCCLPFCDLTNPMCTNEGAECLPWYDPGTAPQGLENVGVCGLMQ